MIKSSTRGQIHEVPTSRGIVRYRERGSGRPVVFVHGFYVNGDLWQDVVPPLAEDFRCITPELPLGSHGLAMNPDADLSPLGVAELIAEFLDALDLDDVVLVGNDSGGAICQIVVTEWPDRIGALVLTPCDAFEKFPPFPYNSLRVLPRVPGAIGLSNLMLKTKLGRWTTFRPLLKSGYDDALVRSWVEPGQQEPAILKDGLKFISGAHPKVTRAIAQRLAEFDRPVLIAWPPKCTFFKYSLAERLAKAFPNARLLPIEDSWTFLPLDQPVALAKAIGAFALAPQPGVTR